VALYEEAYRRVRESGRALCAVSEPIVARLEPSGPSVVVPNGIDPGQWATPGRAPEWFAALPRPRLLYVGTLDRRIDVELVSQAAAAIPDGSVVLVGRTTEPNHFTALGETHNVHIHPRVPHAEVPGLIAAADACMVPHTRTQLTRAMSPLKLYEYLAAGRPVVAVDLPPIRDVSARVVCVGGDEDFGAGARAAIALGPAPEAERRRFIEGNSWRSRHETVLELALRQSRASAADVR
jgi:glycosyltransferase involved in cell wall biosynthesis